MIKSLFPPKLNFRGGLWNGIFGFESSKCPKIEKDLEIIMKNPFTSQLYNKINCFKRLSSIKLNMREHKQKNQLHYSFQGDFSG